MRVRKTLAAIASVAVIGLALQGCSGAASGGSSSGGAVDGTGKTLDVLVAVNNLYADEQKKWFADVSDHFKAETGATVKFETFATSNDELTKIQTSVVSGQGPDIYTLGTTFTPTAYSTGAFVKMTDENWAKVGGRDRFVPATLGISGPDESDEVGIPYASRPFVLAYNKDLLAKAGIDKPATSWDELAAQAKKMTSGDTYGMALAYADNFDPWKFIWGMSIQAGNPIIDGKTTRIDDPITKKAYQTYFSWLTDDKIVDPASVGWKNAQAVAAFADGKAAYLPMTTATTKVTLDKSAVAGKYAYALLPTIPPGETALPSGGTAATSIISGDNAVVAQYSQNQDLAFAFLKMLTSADNQTDYNKRFGDLPTNAEAAKALETGNADLAPIVESAAGSVGTPFSGAWGDTQLALVNVVVQLIPALSNGSVSDSDLETQLKASQATAQASLDKAK